MMFLRRFGFAALLVPAGAFLSLVSRADLNPSLPPATYNAIVDINATWASATSNTPLAPSLVQFVSNNLQLAAAGAASTGGSLDLEGDGSTGSAGPAPHVQVFPVATLADVNSAKELHRRVALLELLLRAARNTSFVAIADAGANGAIAFEPILNTAHLELFVAYSVAFVEAESKDDKCNNYRRALDHAQFLGWTPGGQSLASVPTLPAWSALLSQAGTLFSTNLGNPTFIPSTLCTMTPAVTSSQVESQIRADVDNAITNRIVATTSNAVSALADKRSQFTAFDQASQVNVPTSRIFNLKKAIEDSTTLYAFVAQDELMLERLPADLTVSAGQTSPAPYMTQVAAKRAQVASIQANTAAVGANITAATALYAEHVALLTNVVQALRDISAIPGLDPATQALMSDCAALSTDALTAQNFGSMASALDRCLSEVASVYSNLSQGPASNPDYQPFINRMSELSQAYIGAVTQGH